MRAFAGDSRLSVTHSLPDPGHLIGSGIVKCLLMTHSGRSDLAWPIPPANLLSPLVPDRTNPASNWHLRFSPIEALSQSHDRNRSPRPRASSDAVENRPKGIH